MTTAALAPPNVLTGVWRLADPKISLASFASLFVGACVAVSDGSFHGGWFTLTVLAVFAIEIAKNASGEVFDFDSGADLAVADADRTPFSGGKRVLVDGLLTREQTIAIAIGFYAVAVMLGVTIVFGREPAALGFGALGLLLAWQYQAPPLRLSYRGWGEVAVALVYGPLLCVATVLVSSGRISRDAALVSIPLGLLVGAFLWINELPDCAADRSAGKRTLVARLGRRAASRVFAAIVATALVALVLLPLAGLPRSVLWGAIAAGPAAFAVGRALREPERTRALVPAQAATLLAFVLYALGAGLGLAGAAR
jgi:1,4-dihydroxy-2-naphthoate octaprenyltransferase